MCSCFHTCELQFDAKYNRCQPMKHCKHSSAFCLKYLKLIQEKKWHISQEKYDGMVYLEGHYWNLNLRPLIKNTHAFLLLCCNSSNLIDTEFELQTLCPQSKSFATNNTTTLPVPLCWWYIKNSSISPNLLPSDP